MAVLTTFLANKLLDEVCKNTNYVPPAVAYLALFTTATTDAGGGTEVTGGSYARQAVTFATAASKATTNTVAVSFTTMPACTVTDAAIMDASTAGNMLLHNTLTASKTVGAGDTLTFAIGDVDASLA